MAISLIGVSSIAGIASSAQGTSIKFSASSILSDPMPIKEYSVPLQNAGPESIATASDGSFWIAEYKAGMIAHFFPSNGTFSQFSVPESRALPTYITLDVSGRVWFSDQKDFGSIWMFDPSVLKFTQHSIPTPFSYPVGVLADGQNNIWFAEDSGNKLGELTYPSYYMEEFSLPNPNSGPAELALQPGGVELWVTESLGNRIARFDMVTHAFSEFLPYVLFNSPVGIVLDSMNNVWVSEHGGSSIVRFDPTTGSFTKFLTSPPDANSSYGNSAPATLAIDKLGRFWFVEHFSNRIGRFDPVTKSVDEFVIPSSGVYSVLSAIDEEGNFWFTEFDANKIGMVLGNASLPVDVRALGEAPSTTAGHTQTIYFKVSDKGPSDIGVRLSGASTFLQNAVTSASQVSLNVTSLSLTPGASVTVSATFTPDSGTVPGSYSVGVSASYADSSSIGIASFSVTPTLINILLFQTFPDLLAVAIILLVIADLVIWKRIRNKKEPKERNAVRSLLFVVSLLVLLMFALSPVPPVMAKCPGLPGLGPSSSGPSYGGIILDAVELFVTVVLAEVFIRSLREYRRQRREPNKANAN
ncbi:MAG: hypothetical protein OK438_01215 [Thaumarchaeota archaeon]|nr:hypothetical protein [Nitrososphaerota archaeon]